MIFKIKTSNSTKVMTNVGILLSKKSDKIFTFYGNSVILSNLQFILASCDIKLKTFNFVKIYILQQKVLVLSFKFTILLNLIFFLTKRLKLHKTCNLWQKVIIVCKKKRTSNISKFPFFLDKDLLYFLFTNKNRWFYRKKIKCKAYNFTKLNKNFMLKSCQKAYMKKNWNPAKFSI